MINKLIEYMMNQGYSDDQIVTRIIEKGLASIQPDQKDIDRAKGIQNAAAASKMAKVIKDGAKLARRAKAVYAEHGDGEIFQPFEDAMRLAGYSDEEIDSVKSGEDFDMQKAVRTGIEKRQSSPRRRSGRPSPILPIGTVNPRTGTCKYFNIYDTWGKYQTTVEVYLDMETQKHKYVITSGGALTEVDEMRGFVHDQMPGRYLFDGICVATYDLNDFKDSRYGSCPGYVYK